MSKRVRNPFQELPPGTPEPRPSIGDSQSPNFSNGIKPLNPQQQLFVDYYLETYKAADSAEKAGYNRMYGAQLLQMPNVQDAIRQVQETRRRATAITQDRVLQEIATVAFGDLSEFFNDFGGGVSLNIKNKKDLSEDQRRQMASIEETWRGNNRTLKFKTHDKLRALTLLSQYMGLLDGTGRQIDPEGMAQRLRQAAAKATDSLPSTVAGDSSDDILDPTGNGENYYED